MVHSYRCPATLPKVSSLQPGSFSLLGPQVSCPLHLGKSASENRSGRGGPSALQGWAWAAAAHVPLSALQGAASARSVYLARESGYLRRKGTQGSPPPRPCGLFSRFRAPGVRRGILGKNGGGASNGQKPSGYGVSCFLTAYDLAPISAPVSSFNSWDRVTTDTTLKRT